DWSNLVDAAAEGLALIYFNPRLYFILGLALARLGRKADAICELRVAVKQNPTLVRAYDALGRLHADHPLLALEYRQKASDLRRRIRAERSARVVWQAGSSAPPVTSAAPATTAAPTTTAPAVTSPVLATQQYDFSGLCQQVPCGPDRRDEEVIDVLGLPRSGTSMLMRVLEAGGIPVLSDGLRAADENNRHGYYEYEPIKKIAELGAAGWIHQAAGKAVKVVTPLVKYLPPKTPIRLLVVHRPLAQVLASQEAMKDRLGTHTQVSANSLATQFIAELEKVNKLVADRANWQILHLSYESMLADPAGQCARIAQFLGASFSPIPAAAAVDAAQRRFT
ncbi:MAG: sulfotransferase domain-containing protein, partial [Planctomycetota bacterium]